MRRFESWWQRATARVLCVALLIASITSVTHARTDCDGDCAAALVVGHDASAHSIRSDTALPDEPPIHCLACHWARSFRPSATAGYLDAPAQDAGLRCLVEAAPVAAVSTIAQPPLRSPPFSL
jgi:hypothetical protein